MSSNKVRLPIIFALNNLHLKHVVYFRGVNIYELCSGIVFLAVCLRVGCRRGFMQADPRKLRYIMLCRKHQA